MEFATRCMVKSQGKCRTSGRGGSERSWLVIDGLAEVPKKLPRFVGELVREACATGAASVAFQAPPVW
jgi:hypothetical protein